MNVCAECGQIHALDPKEVNKCVRCLKRKTRYPNCERLAECLRGKDKTCNSILDELARSSEART